MANYGLKPCPFCGNKEIRMGYVMPRFGEEVMHYVSCAICRCRTDNFRKELDAVKNWNRRSSNNFAPSLMPMGALTYAIACSHCKNRGSSLCDNCRCEVESGFKLDPDTVEQKKVVHCKDCTNYKEKYKRCDNPNQDCSL